MTDMRLCRVMLALAVLCTCHGPASAARLNKCVAGQPWYRGSTTSADIRGFGEFYRRPDGSMYFTRGSGIEKYEVNEKCFARLKNPPPVYHSAR